MISWEKGKKLLCRVVIELNNYDESQIVGMEYVSSSNYTWHTSLTLIIILKRNFYAIFRLCL